MGREQSRTPQVEEISDLSHTVKLGRHVVFVKCFAVGGRAPSRYEVNLHCGSHTAIIDIPAGPRSHIEDRIGQAVSSFVETVQLRVAG